MGKASTDLKGCQAVRGGVQSLHKGFKFFAIKFWGFVFEKGMGGYWVGNSI